MTLDIIYLYSDAIVNVPLNEHGAVLAAQQVLQRFPTPVSESDQQFEEQIFRGSAVIGLGMQADDLFLVIPRHPGLGMLGPIVVRRHAGATPSDIDDLVAESAGGERFVLEPPEVTTHETPLGVATRNLLRWTVGSPAKKRGLFRKAELPITEQLSWYWHIEDEAGDSTILNITLLNQNLARSAVLVAAVDSFAQGITVAS